MEATSQTNIVANQSTYNYPTDLSKLNSLKYNGFRLKFMTFQEFNEYLDGYSAPVGTSPYGPGIPEVFMIWNKQITLFPTPSTNLTNGLTIYYIRHPTPVALTSDTPDVPTNYHRAIVDYCLRQAYELDEDSQKQMLKDQAFQAKLMQQNGRNKKVDEYYPRITILPEDENYGAYGYQGGF